MNPCKNCGYPLKDQFCSHCGQKAKVERITFTYICHEIFHFFTHIESGFLFTSRNMIVEPGRTVVNFLDGKRKIYQPPVSYFLIWVAIFLLFLFGLEKVYGENTVIDYKEYFGPATTTKFAISHLSFVLMVIIPVQAFYLYVLVTRNKYNYFETMVASIYSIGTIILFQFVFAVLALLIHLVSGLTIDIFISDSFKLIYMSWFTYNFVKLFPIKLKFFRGLAFLVLALGTFTVWRLQGFPTLIELFN